MDSAPLSRGRPCRRTSLTERRNQREVVIKATTPGAPMLKYALKKFVRDSKCRISWSSPFGQRAARRREGNVTAPREDDTNGGSSHPNRFVSWNVRGFAAKKVEICASLAKMRAAVVGLQETFVPEEGRQLRMPGYRVYARPGSPSNEDGYRGVALAISRRLVSFETGPHHRHWVCAKVLGLGQGEAWYVINVYRSQRRGLAEEFTALKRYIARLRRTEPDARVVMMGDLNWEPERLDSRVLRPCDLVRVPFKGSDKTFHGGRRGGNRWTSIDHFLVTGNVLRSLSKAKTRRAYSASDHFPISMKVRRPAERTGEDQGERGPEKLLSRERLREAADKGATHPEWERLEAGMPRAAALEIDDFVRSYTESSERVLTECKLLKERSTDHKMSLPKSVKRTLKAKRRAWRRYLRADEGRAPELFRAYRARRREAKLAIKEERERGWIEYLEEGSRFLRQGDSKRFFRWARRTFEGSDPNFVSPLKDGEGVIQLDPQKIKDLWDEHYRGLASDVTGHSRSDKRCRGLGMEMADPMPGLNGRITLKELYTTIRVMKPSKAPGEDGPPAEWYKACPPDPVPEGREQQGDSWRDVRHMEAEASPEGPAGRSHPLDPKERGPDREGQLPGHLSDQRRTQGPFQARDNESPIGGGGGREASEGTGRIQVEGGARRPGVRSDGDRERGDRTSTTQWRRARYAETVGFRREAIFHVGAPKGVNWVVRARCSGLWTVKRAIEFDPLDPETVRGKWAACTVDLRDVPEVEHIFSSCWRYDEARLIPEHVSGAIPETVPAEIPRRLEETKEDWLRFPGPRRRSKDRVGAICCGVPDPLLTDALWAGVCTGGSGVLTVKRRPLNSDH
jgi:exonuclease III